MLTRSFLPPEDAKRILAYSPMYHARLFREQATVRSQHFQPTRAATSNKDDDSIFLDGNPSIDRPLFVQFCANEPDDLLEAARHVAPYCDAVDLNLGCPQGIAKKGHYGAFLQEDWDTIYKLINRLHKDLSVPVTAKFRILETKEQTLEYAKMILSAGANIITLHGRRRDQKGHNTGLADWDYIRYLRENLPPETVIFANGNILNRDDLDRCLEATGADGVMSAEGNLSDPSIFSEPPPVGSETREYWRGKDGKGGYRLDAVLRRYLDIIYKYVLETPAPERKSLYLPSGPKGEKEPTPDPAVTAEPEDGPPKKKQKRDRAKRPNSPSLGVMQGHLFQLLRPMIAQHTNVRDALAKARPGDMPAYENVLSLVEKAIKGGLDEYEGHPERFVELPDAQLTGSKTTIAKYGRPWWICQPHIRPLPEEALENGALHLRKKDLPKEKQTKAFDPQAKTPAAGAKESESESAASASNAANAATPSPLVNG